MKTINIVIGTKLKNYIHTSKYFKSNLGFSRTIQDPKSSNRIYTKGDEFAVSYNHQYKTTISKLGGIGNIDIYLDYYINDNSIAIYYNLEEYVYTILDKELHNKTIDEIIGLNVKDATDKYNELFNKNIDDDNLKDNISEQTNEEFIDKNTIFINPGTVTSKDLEEYKKRFKK